MRLEYELWIVVRYIVIQKGISPILVKFGINVVFEKIFLFIGSRQC